MSLKATQKGLQNQQRQRGGALLVAMVMIFMLSIMGITSMRGSSLERRMATNSVQSAATFQSAESLTDLALNNSVNLENAWRGQGTPYRVPSIDLQNNFTAAHGVEAVYQGTSVALGFSLGVDAGSNFSAFQYEVVGGTVIEETRTRSAVAQGAYRIVPGL